MGLGWVAWKRLIKWLSGKHFPLPFDEIFFPLFFRAHSLATSYGLMFAMSSPIEPLSPAILFALANSDSLLSLSCQYTHG